MQLTCISFCRIENIKWIQTRTSQLLQFFHPKTHKRNSFKSFINQKLGVHIPIDYTNLFEGIMMCIIFSSDSPLDGARVKSNHCEWNAGSLINPNKKQKDCHQNIPYILSDHPQNKYLRNRQIFEILGLAHDGVFKPEILTVARHMPIRPAWKFIYV
jgi:hypothetical protein